jgi:hypothetical protein
LRTKLIICFGGKNIFVVFFVLSPLPTEWLKENAMGKVEKN